MSEHNYADKAAVDRKIIFLTCFVFFHVICSTFTANDWTIRQFFFAFSASVSTVDNDLLLIL